jgi:hypothetical protein
MMATWLRHNPKNYYYYYYYYYEVEVWLAVPGTKQVKELYLIIMW